jgi:hypothetical protein
MSTMKESYGGGKHGKALEGMVTHNPKAEDKSRAPIGEKYAHVDTGAVRSEPSKQDPTIGPRSA